MDEIKKILQGILDELMERRAGVDPEALLPTKVAARFVLQSEDTLLLAAKSGLVPHYETGKGFGFRREDLLAYREKFRRVGDVKKSKVLPPGSGGMQKAQMSKVEKLKRVA